MRNKTLLKLMLLFAKISMVLVILASVILSTVMIISYFNPAFRPDFQIGYFDCVPTSALSGEYITSHSSSPVEINSVSVKLSGFHPEPKILFFIILSMVITVLITLFMLQQVIQVLKSLEQNLIFIRENALRLRRIALAMIVIWGISKLISIILTLYFMETVVFKNFKFQSYEWGQEWFTHTLLSGIVLWIIAEVFRYGTVLKEEAELTI